MSYLSILLLIGSVFVAACNTRATPPENGAKPIASSPEAAPSHTPTNSASPPALAAEKGGPAPSLAEPGTSSRGPAASPETRIPEVTIPAGTTLRLQLGSTVSSRSSRVEDAVTATVRQAIVIDGVTVVPVGAVVTGYVTEATRAGRVKGRARVGIRFTSLRIGDARYDIRTSPISREAPGTKREDATRIGIGAGAGAVAGAIAGGKKGAAIGSAVGAAGGTGVVLATRGEEVSLGRGATVTTRFSDRLPIRVR